MKKLLALTLACSLALAPVGCGSKPVTPPPGMSAMDQLSEDATPVDTVLADFQDKVNSKAYKTNEELAAALAAAEYLPFDGATMQVEEGPLNGFTEEITGFKEAWMFGPSISSIPFIGYVFEVDKNTNILEFMEKLNSSADLGWNICTQADQCDCASVNTTVCFVMSTASFEE